MLFFDLAPPMLHNSGIFHDSTRPYLHSDSLPPKSRRSVVSIYDIGCVTKYYRKKNEKNAHRDANTARALAVVRFGHRPPVTDTHKHKHTHTHTHKQTGPITIHCAAS